MQHAICIFIRRKVINSPIHTWTFKDKENQWGTTFYESLIYKLVSFFFKYILAKYKGQQNINWFTKSTFHWIIHNYIQQTTFTFSMRRVVHNHLNNTNFCQEILKLNDYTCMYDCTCTYLFVYFISQLEAFLGVKTLCATLYWLYSMRVCIVIKSVYLEN